MLAQALRPLFTLFTVLEKCFSAHLPMSAWENMTSFWPRCSSVHPSWGFQGWWLPPLCYLLPPYVPCWAAVILIDFASPVPKSLMFNFYYIMISTYFSYIIFTNFCAFNFAFMPEWYEYSAYYTVQAFLSTPLPIMSSLTWNTLFP